MVSGAKAAFAGSVRDEMVRQNRAGHFVKFLLVLRLGCGTTERGQLEVDVTKRAFVDYRAAVRCKTNPLKNVHRLTLMKRELLRTGERLRPGRVNSG